MTSWTNTIKNSTSWSGDSKSTLEKAILTEDSFILLCEDGTYLLQEDANLDWGNSVKSSTSWSSPARA